jgi:hypothetical protein|tara:strand:+ start:860 stop:1465 length:606 start_codon:yes stop_codon:yes gene_type:complete
MQCLIIFGAENAHPLAWMLSQDRRHVWCALQDTDRNAWVSYNWHKGLPIIQAEAAADYDLAAHYRDQGYTVVETERGTAPRLSPFILNNCVGHVKLVCGLRSRALTPHQLHRSLTCKRSSLRMRLKHLMMVPGFGGGSAPAPPPPPPPLPPPPTKADPAVVKAREDSQRRLRQQRGLAGTIKADQNALGTATTADKTLLGN